MPGCGVAAGSPVVERRHGKAGDRRGDVRRDNPCHRARVPGETLRRSVSVVGCGGPALVEGRRWALNGRHNNKMPSNGGPMLSAHSKDHVDCVSRVLRNAARLPQAPVPTPILDSWRRSMEQHRLDPGSLQGPRILSQTLLDECRERSELFLRIASEADPAHPRRGNRALRRTHRTRRGSPGMPARLSLAGQCPPVAACVALRLRAVRRRHPATRRPSGRAAWRRPDTGQCVRERRRSGARRPARRPRAASLETHGRGAGTGYLASDPVSAGAPAWHPHAGPGGRLRCAGGRRSRQARKIKTSLEPCPVNAGGLSL